MESEGSSPYSQQPATYVVPKDQSDSEVSMYDS
jgi:hypothetical protein